MKITTDRLKEIIKEEIEVTLTNEEAAEMFGDEVLEELNEDVSNITLENLMLAINTIRQVAETFAPAALAPATVLLKQVYDGWKHANKDAEDPVKDLSVLDHPDSAPEM